MQGLQPTVDATDYFVISPNSGQITIAMSLAADTSGSGSGKRPMYKVWLSIEYQEFLATEVTASMLGCLKKRKLLFIRPQFFLFVG